MKVADKIRLLREMLFARRFEERCYEAYVERKIGGFLHLYPGQEACCHGVLEAAQIGHDYVITSYRDHVHAIKWGSEPKRIMAELYAKETGVSRVLGGSMHIFDVENKFMGGYALVGGPFPLAAGIGKALQMKESDAICICFLGDAANNQGTFHESLNMAKLWNLPVLYVCENNLYGIGTRIDRSTAVVDQYKRVSGYNIPSSQEDGQDVELVYKSAVKAIKHVREGKGPYSAPAGRSVAMQPGRTSDRSPATRPSPATSPSTRGGSTRPGSAMSGSCSSATPTPTPSRNHPGRTTGSCRPSAPCPWPAT